MHIAFLHSVDCAEVDVITSGRHAGETWLRPLALRTCANASLALAAQRFDPSIGWLDGTLDSDVHLFSPAAPVCSIFRPHGLLVTPTESAYVNRKPLSPLAPVRPTQSSAQAHECHSFP